MGFLILPLSVPFVIVLSFVMVQHHTNYLSPKLSLSSPLPLLRMIKSSGKFSLLGIVSSALLQSWSNFFYTISRNLHKTIQKYENIFPKKCTVEYIHFNSKDRPKGITWTTNRSYSAVGGGADPDGWGGLAAHVWRRHRLPWPDLASGHGCQAKAGR